MDRLEQANTRLRSGKIRLRIEQIGDRLILRGTLPPKPESELNHPYRQRIFLGVSATAAGISFAEAKAKGL